MQKYCRKIDIEKLLISYGRYQQYFIDPLANEGDQMIYYGFMQKKSLPKKAFY